MEDIARAYVYCNELLFSECSGIGTGALCLLQIRVNDVKNIDKKRNTEKMV